MNLMQRRRALMAQKKARLPSAYQEVQWIGGTGTQYLDVGVTPSNTFGVEVVLSAPNVQTDTVLCGCRQSSGDTRCYIGVANAKPYVGWNTLENIPPEDISPALVADSPFTISVNFLNNRDALYQGNSILWRQLPTLATITRHFLLIGTYASSGNPSPKSEKCYGAKFSSGSSLIRDLVPCYRKSDGVIGMYDLVGETFYINSGSGTFTKGDNVT